MQCNCSDECGKIMGLHHIGVFTPDIEGSIAFYRDVIGLELGEQSTRPNGTRLAFLTVGSCVIELIQPADPSVATGRPEGAVAHIAFAVKDVTKLMCRLYDKGLRFDTDKPGEMPDLFANGSKSVFFKGPNGERLEFFEQL